MDELLSLIKAIRKLEALCRPLFPRRWRDPPVSYRMAIPLIHRLEHSGRLPAEWRQPLLYNLNKIWYRAYHQDGLDVSQLSDRELKWLRLIVLVILVVLVMATLPSVRPIASAVHVGLFLGAVALGFVGAMHLSLPALWAVWGLTFPVLGPPFLQTAPWALLLIAVGTLCWHLPLMHKDIGGSILEILATVPTLFFWLTVTNVVHVPGMHAWESGIAVIAIWGIIWWTVRNNWGGSVWKRTTALIWPVSFVTVGGLILIRPVLERLGWMPFRFVLWWGSTIGISLVLSRGQFGEDAKEARWLRIVGSVLWGIALLGLIVQSGSPMRLLEALRLSINAFYGHMHMLLWFIGAGLVMYVRKYAVAISQWVAVITRPEWVWLIVSIGAAAVMFGTGKQITLFPGWVLHAFTLLYIAIGGVLLLFKRAPAVSEWVFWGIYLFLLLARYQMEVQRLLQLQGNIRHVSLIQFFMIMAWLLWLIYDVISENLASQIPPSAPNAHLVVIAWTGALLWVFTDWGWSILSTQAVDRWTFLQLHLYLGVHFLGMPYILYYLVLRRYWTGAEVPWLQVVLFGIMGTQILQAIEHYLIAGTFLNWSPDQLHAILTQHILQGIETPAELMGIKGTNPAAVWGVRAIRWGLIMLGFALWYMRSAHYARSRAVQIATFVFVSLAVSWAESMWIQWPGMPPYWSVAFRPAQETAVYIWGIEFLYQYGIYAAAGGLLGYAVTRFFARAGS